MFDSELYYVKWPAPELVEMDHLNLPPFNWNSKEYQLQIQLVGIYEDNAIKTCTLSYILLLDSRKVLDPTEVELRKI